MTEDVDAQLTPAICTFKQATMIGRKLLPN